MRPDVDGFIGQHKEAENNNKKLVLSPPHLSNESTGRVMFWGGGKGVEPTCSPCKQPNPRITK